MQNFSFVTDVNDYLMVSLCQNLYIYYFSLFLDAGDLNVICDKI